MRTFWEPHNEDDSIVGHMQVDPVLEIPTCTKTEGRAGFRPSTVLTGGEQLMAEWIATLVLRNIRTSPCPSLFLIW